MFTTNNPNFRFFKNSIVMLLLTLTFIMGLFACSNVSVEPVTRQEFLMGTSINISIYSNDANRILDRIFTRLREIDRNMSAQYAGSELNKINDAAGLHPVKVKDDLFEVIKASIETSKIGNGEFDITIGPIVNLWDIAGDNPHVPKDAEIAKLLPLVNFRLIVLNETEHTVYLPKPGMRLELGGIAKGYGADEAVAICKASDVEHALINLGSSAITVIGTKPNGSPWRIGIQRPDQDRGNIMGVLSCANAIIQTSGPYERFFIDHGKRYHHIMDPRTGRPSESDLDQVTVYSTQNSMRDDSLSTTLFILGLDKGMALVRSLPGVEAIFVTKDHKVTLSPGLKDAFTLKDPAFTLN